MKKDYIFDSGELDSIIEAFSDGIYISDAYGNGLRVNKAYEQITGLTAGELVDQNLADIVAQGLINKSSVLKVLEKKQPVTFTQKYKDGKEMLVTSNPVFNKRGELVHVVTTVRDVTELSQLQKMLSESDERSKKYYQELVLLREQQLEMGHIVAASQAMQAVVDLAKRAAQVDSTCLILGESGVGKDVIARLIHSNSTRSGQAFIKINCGAIPRELLEAELFGYEAGAFTGARKEGKPGMFELAHEGTLFLDEIGEMPLELQVKLLEVLQDMTIHRVGGTKSIHIDVRIVAATNRNIEEMVQKGRFREDLYYRLNIIPIEVPPLRERPEDILPLVEMILRQLNEKFARQTTLSSEVIQCLLSYHWPGNIRELRNIIERMLVMSREDLVGLEAVPRSLSRQCEYLVRNLSSNKLKEVLEEVEKNLLLKTLAEKKSIRKAAEVLGIDHSTVCRKMQKYGLSETSYNGT
ncbi:MAG: sigma 54-interacting transcriptional regulator [Clostridia bacterium]|nr:sigma 54-interacting transcriptional regulator [Clostridia bacterium]